VTTGRSRRSRERLEAAVGETGSDADRAKAHYELGLFHDNNGREAEAIPHYEAALGLGLDGETRAMCLAWLASSLLKTGRAAQALVRLAECQEMGVDGDLLRFVERLDKRIKRGEIRR
jgi:hypothetical protein